MILCILKSVVAYVILIVVGANLLGFVVRGFWEPLFMDSIGPLLERLAEIFARERRRMRIANLVTTLVFLLLMLAYLISLFYFFKIGVVLEDLDLLQDASGSLGLQERYGLNTPAGNLAFHERMLQLSRETFDLGTELIHDPR